MEKIEEQLFLGGEDIFPKEEGVVAAFLGAELWEVPDLPLKQDSASFNETENLSVAMGGTPVEEIPRVSSEVIFGGNQVFVGNHPSYQSDIMVSSIENSYFNGEDIGAPFGELPWFDDEKEPSSFLQSTFNFGERIFENESMDLGDSPISSAFYHQNILGGGESSQGKDEVHIHNEIPAINIEFSGAIDSNVDVEVLMRDMQKRIKEEMEANTDFAYHY